MSVAAARMRKLKEIGKLLRTQDNRATDCPIFLVQQRKRVYGMESDYTDSFVWVDTDNDHQEATVAKTKSLDKKVQNGKDTDPWERVGYVDIWEFVTACFTEQACKDYIFSNSHNLTDPRIYAAGSYRNDEFRLVQDYIKNLPEPGDGPMADEFVLMPQALTAENGAKAELIGEFTMGVPNPAFCECGSDECIFCQEDDEEQSETIEVTVPWTTIKQIYARCVKFFTEDKQPT